MPKPTQRIVLQVSIEEYQTIKTLQQERGFPTVSALLKAGIEAIRASDTDALSDRP